MRKLNKKWIIGISSTILLILMVAVLFLLPRTTNKSYVAYVDINPLIKLNFTVSCKNDDCAEPVVTDYELINEDAKTIYKEVDIKNRTLKDTIEVLTNAVKDNDIYFKEVHIYTNYENNEDFKIDSTDYNIIIDVNKEDIEEVVSELISQEESLVTKEVIVPLSFSKVEVEDKMMHMKDFEFLEERDKIIEKEYTRTYEEGYDFIFNSILDIDLTYKGVGYYFPITIKGPKEILETIPNEYTTFKPNIKGLVDISGLNEGIHEVKMEFVSDISGITIQTKPIKMLVEIELGTRNYSTMDENGKFRVHHDENFLKELLSYGLITQEEFEELLEKNSN